MTAILRNGDYCPDGMGGFRQAWGGELEEHPLQDFLPAPGLADVPDLQVTGATWDEGGQRLHVELEWKGAPLMAEVPL